MVFAALCSLCHSPAWPSLLDEAQRLAIHAGRIMPLPKDIQYVREKVLRIIPNELPTTAQIEEAKKREVARKAALAK